MKKYIALLAFLLASAPGALAAQLPIQAQEFPAINNLLVNAGFENGSYGWTASGGATKTANTTAKGLGSYGYDWDSNSAAQTLISSSITIPPSLYGKNGVAYCQFKTPSGTATHTMVVDDGTNALVPVQAITSASTFQRTAVNFIFPSSGSVRLKMASVASNEPEIYIDSCYLGEASNVQQISQAQNIGTVYFGGVANCTWTTTSSSYADFAADSDCNTATVTGQVTSGGKTPTMTVPSVGPGTYLVNFQFSTLNTVAAAESCAVVDDAGNTFTGTYQGDGATSITRPASLWGQYTYTTGQGSRTFKLQCSTSSGTMKIVADQAGRNFTGNVYKFPSTTEIAYRPDQGPASWSGYNDGTNWTSTTTGSFVALTPAGTSTLTQLQNRNFGTVTQATSNLPGITFTPPRPGRYLVLANTNSTPSAAELCYYQLFDSLNNSLVGGGGYNAGSAGSDVGQVAMAAIVDYQSSSATTLSIRSKATGGTCTTGTYSSPGAVNWAIVSLDTPITAPVLVGSVTSNSTGMERVERVKVTSTCSGSPCTIASQSGSWVTSVTRSATGTYTANLTSGIFSATPTCTCNADYTYSDANAPYICIMDTSGSSSTAVKFATVTGNGGSSAHIDASFGLVCMGPR
jgi:hypothetical protein